MQAAQRGDAEAYERLLRALLPVLRTFVGLRVRDPALREDVVQTVLLHLHRARHTYRPERPFGPWLRAIARNASTDALRALGRQTRRETPLDEALSATTPAAPIAPATPAGLRADLAAALAELPAAQREALELFHLQDLTVLEAASRVGVSPGAFKLRVHRAVSALRKRFGAEQP